MERMKGKVGWFSVSVMARTIYFLIVYPNWNLKGLKMTPRLAHFIEKLQTLLKLEAMLSFQMIVSSFNALLIVSEIITSDLVHPLAVTITSSAETLWNCSVLEVAILNTQLGRFSMICLLVLSHQNTGVKHQQLFSWCLLTRHWPGPKGSPWSGSYESRLCWRWRDMVPQDNPPWDNVR